ncbi:GGDEF domain-containing phosphodiesterase [Thalassotalea sp. G2M2-11]|uniref:GGDEF domain-containing phosphodiesterase n=1 Tax=Thalassotalea sp. G2M2-11 TaxID=2787627 RepID=UPI0019D04A0C|nr:GGDEF domain-containing phosphodiesterase [Thalassotalea sp. G2M2-11]
MKRIVNLMTSIFFSLILVLSHSVMAITVDNPSPNYNFVEFNIAFVLGLCLPVLLILAFLKPIMNISWRFPALMTLSVIGQFYALVYLQQWQTLGLLFAATTYIAFASLWVIEQQGQKIKAFKYNWLVVAMSILMLGSAIAFRELDAYKVWLGFLIVSIAIATYVQLSVRDNSLIRTLSTWGITAGYGVTLYFWLNAQLDLVWFVSLTVLSYLGQMTAGCWSSVQTLVNRFEHITQVVNSDAEPFKDAEKVYDPITNLPTYHQGLSHLNQILKLQASGRYVAIVFKPLNFEQVNQVLGHQNSDILLLQLAYSLQKSMSDNALLIDFSDTREAVKLCRLQGLDFMVVVDTSLSEHDNKLVVEDICQQLNNAVPQAISFKSFSLNFQLAFGISLLNQESQSGENLIAQASDALLEAENTLQQICHFDQKSRLYTEQQLAKMEKLKQDVSNERLVWLANPQVSLSDRQFIGFELEIDWQCNEGNKLTQHEFDQIAEYSGEIYQITKQMVKQAFDLLVIMHSLDITEKVAINLSSKELLEPELADFIEHQVERTNIKAQYLTIELTEQVLLGSPFRARMMIDQLRVLGVNIAIDDFSGSYEGLRYLRKASVQQVKVECSRLQQSQEAKSEKTIVNALINLIRKMQIPLIGTGVNNQEIEKSYLLMGGNFAQGNAIQSGITLDKVENWLAASQARKNQA